MTIHILGKKEDSICIRYSYTYTDQEFKDLLQEVGGFLPIGWRVWNFDENETIYNSFSFREFYLNIPSSIQLYGCEPAKVWIKEMLKDDAMEQLRKEMLGLI